MTDIIGVNHFSEITQGYDTWSKIPQKSRALLNHISGKTVGVEATDSKTRLELLIDFFYPDGPSRYPQRTAYLFNPLSLEPKFDS